MGVDGLRSKISDDNGDGDGGGEGVKGLSGVQC